MVGGSGSIPLAAVFGGSNGSMSVMWRARDVPRPERVYYMRDAAANAIVPLDLWYEDKEQDFDGWIRAADLGPVRFVHTSAPRGRVARTPTLIRRSDPELYWMSWQLRERCVVEQNDRQAGLGPGDFALVDLSLPCGVTGSFLETAHLVFPRAMLPLGRQETGGLAGMALAGRARGALITSLVRQLARDLDACNGAGADRIGTALLDLVTATLLTRLGRGEAIPRPTGIRALSLRIHTFIEERLGDPQLSPSMIAAAHFISTRYLHRLFEYEGKTVSAWVRSRRLERCRRDLLDPAMLSRPVATIAMRWGFTDPGYFSRVFREVYGLPPGEYRRLAAAGCLPAAGDTGLSGHR